MNKLLFLTMMLFTYLLKVLRRSPSLLRILYDTINQKVISHNPNLQVSVVHTIRFPVWFVQIAVRSAGSGIRSFLRAVRQEASAIRPVEFAVKPEQYPVRSLKCAFKSEDRPAGSDACAHRLALHALESVRLRP